MAGQPLNQVSGQVVLQAVPKGVGLYLGVDHFDTPPTQAHGKILHKIDALHARRAMQSLEFQKMLNVP